ncbi:MAG TPA: L-erythro-3,5-diaminohexanoate dehydrogenase [Candidatus Limnocylindrales bacterium]|nr:L-erythro-3,5-diaminohexanoate dehydrogenase [Candidatus Limnocylindrales bacterium]
MRTSPIGLHRVVLPVGVLPQAAEQLDNRPEIGADEVRVAVERLNLDAASYRQLFTKHGTGEGVRTEVLEIVGRRGKMHNPVTGSGGMLMGVVEEVGPASPLGLEVGDRVATLVSLTLTPLAIIDGLKRWDGLSEQVPCEGHAILFARSIAAVLPSDMDAELALAVMDVCGAPALTTRVIQDRIIRDRLRVAQDPAICRANGPFENRQADDCQANSGILERVAVSVAVIGAAGKSGCLSLAAARRAGASRVVGVVPNSREADLLRVSELADEVTIADARNPVALAEAIGPPVDVTVVCVDVPGCEHGAILATAQGGTIVFFSMATSFSAAALGAEGLAADVTMLIGNGFVPGHAACALDLVREVPAVRAMLQARLQAH